MKFSTMKPGFNGRRRRQTARVSKEEGSKLGDFSAYLSFMSRKLRPLGKEGVRRGMKG